MKKMKTSSKRKVGLPTILPDLICFTVKKQRNGLVNYQLFNVTLRISAGRTLKFTKKYVRNKKIIHNIGRWNSADRILGVVVYRKLYNLSLSTLELQQRGQCRIGSRQLAKRSVILLNGTKIIICVTHSAALETHQETRLKTSLIGNKCWNDRDLKRKEETNLNCVLYI